MRDLITIGCIIVNILHAVRWRIIIIIIIMSMRLYRTSTRTVCELQVEGVDSPLVLVVVCTPS